jgi:DNA-directed RNA polymerase subunit RPC12/RpoP
MISDDNINNVLEACTCNHCRTKILFDDDDYEINTKTVVTRDTVTRYKVFDCPRCRKEIHLKINYF